MSIYRKFCRETVTEDGKLLDIEFDYPDNFNFGYDVVDAVAASDPSRRAIVWSDAESHDRVFTFADIRDESNRVANVLSATGIGRGDRVMVALKRHFEYWFAAIALHKLGAVMIPVTHMLTVPDLVFRLRAADVVAVISTPQDHMPEKVLAAQNEAGTDAILWSVGSGAPGFRDLSEEAAAAAATLERRDTRVTDPMLLYFTSGTTGDPKGVFHDFAYPLAHIVTAKYWQRAEPGGLHFTVAETGWAKASWGKLYGQWLVGSAVMVYDFDHFDPQKLASVINRCGVTSFCAPPTIYRYMARRGFPAMPGLRHASTAGETLSAEIFRRFEEQTGLALAEGYGQTETTLLTANFKGDSPVAGAMGTPSPLYDVKLIDENGEICADGEVGEVVVVPRAGERPIGVFSGYLSGEAAYAEAWRGGVYHTGDAAKRDSDGILYFFGRFDDIIKTGGFRVGPGEVENAIQGHPAVLEVTVIGVPDALRGQAIKAIIVLADGYEPGKELYREIKEFANHKLAEYKWVRIIEFVEEMPKTISGKIRKKTLREAVV